MKFIIKFVARCASPVADEDHSNRRRSETRALVVSPNRRCKRKKRSSSPISSSAPAWKPSLTAISEDKAVVLGERKAKRTHCADSRTPRRSSQERQDHFTAIPTFSPTPFMF